MNFNFCTLSDEKVTRCIQISVYFLFFLPLFCKLQMGIQRKPDIYSPPVCVLYILWCGTKKGWRGGSCAQNTCTHQHQADRASDTRCVCYVQQIMSSSRLLAFEAILCRYCDCCPRVTIISYRAWPKGKKRATDRRKTKKLTRSAITTVSHLG